MNSPQTLTPSETWKVLEQPIFQGSVVFLTVLVEDADTEDLEVRKQIADQVENTLLTAPGLKWYCRVGMYDFLGFSPKPTEVLEDWAGRKLDVRCGVAALEGSGLKRTELLMMGTSEAARSNREHSVFRLADNWVVPVPRPTS